jgi:hypothetical protein
MSDIAQRVAKRLDRVQKKAQAKLVPVDVTITSYYDGENVDIVGTFEFEGKMVSINSSCTASLRGCDIYIDDEFIEWEDPLHTEIDEALTDLFTDVMEKGNIDVNDQNFSAVFKDRQLVSVEPTPDEED